MMQNIVEQRIEMKPYFSVEAKSMLQALLERDPTKRLGYGEEDATEIKRHPFFAKIDWDQLHKKQIEPPFKPVVKGPDDTSNIDKMFTNETPKQTPGNTGNMSPNALEANHFKGFTYAASANVKGINKPEK